jgi:hypothetical protein
VVTNDSKEEWLRRTLHHKLVGSIAAQTEAFRNGILDVVPQQVLDLLYPNELQEMWSGVGLDDSQVGRWREIAYVDESLGQCADWFWEIIGEMTMQERSAVFKFGTGSARLDHADMTGDMQEGEEEAPFTLSIERYSQDVDSDKMLPVAHTCSKQICIPKYSSKNILDQRLRTAVEWAGSGFGMG